MTFVDAISLQEEEERKAEVLKQFTDLEKRANGKRSELKPLQTRIDEISSELEMQDAELVDIKARVRQAEDDHRKSGQRVDVLQAKRNLEQDELDRMQEAMKVMDANLVVRCRNPVCVWDEADSTLLFPTVLDRQGKQGGAACPKPARGQSHRDEAS